MHDKYGGAAGAMKYRGAAFVGMVRSSHRTAADPFFVP